MTKQALRKKYLTARKQISSDQLSTVSQAISQRFFEWIGPLFQQGSIRSVHVFLPIRRHNEVDTYGIIHRLRAYYPTVKLVLSKMHLMENALSHFLWNEALTLQENAWGVPEPVAGEPFPIQQIDLVFVPLIVFDWQGHRVGYGKGYYDRFLTQCPAHTRKVGLSVFQPVPLISDAQPWDVVLDSCITPTKVWQFPASV